MKAGLYKVTSWLVVAYILLMIHYNSCYDAGGCYNMNFWYCTIHYVFKITEQLQCHFKAQMNITHQVIKISYVSQSSDSKDTLFSKRNATFLKLRFFWRRVYTSEWPQVTWPWPWAPGKIHGEKLRFFWKRLYLSPMMLNFLKTSCIE